MKAFKLILTTLNVILISHLAQAQTNTFLKVFNAVPNYTVPLMPYAGLDKLSANSFITAGTRLRTPANTNDTLISDGYIQKTENSGLTKWFLMYHLNGYALYFKDAKVTADKEIVCVGLTNDLFIQSGNTKHGVIMKTDSNGLVKWARIYPRQKIYKMLVRSDGNIAVLASDSGEFFAKNLKLALISPSGIPLWCKRLFTTDNTFRGVSLTEGKNKSILINTNYNIVTLVDSVGNHVRDLIFSPTTPGRGFWRATNYIDKYYYITGYNISGNKLVSTITKTDLQLNIIWHKAYQSLGGDSEFHNIMTLGPNNLLVFCEPENYTTNITEVPRMGFAFLDTNGNVRKSFLFSSDTIRILPADFMELNDGKILFTGFSPSSKQYFGIVDTTSGNFCKETQILWDTVVVTKPVNSNYFSTISSPFNSTLVSIFTYHPSDLSIDYICSSGPEGPLIDTYLQTQEKQDKIRIYPSPCSRYLSISVDEDRRQSLIKFSLVNSLGQVVLEDRNFIDSSAFNIDLNDYPDGLYTLVCQTNTGEMEIKKILLSKKQ